MISSSRASEFLNVIEEQKSGRYGDAHKASGWRSDYHRCCHLGYDVNKVNSVADQAGAGNAMAFPFYRNYQ